MKLISNIEVRKSLKKTKDNFFLVPRSILWKMYLNFAFKKNFCTEILTMILFTYWNNINPFSRFFCRLELSEEALCSWSRKSHKQNPPPPLPLRTTLLLSPWALKTIHISDRATAERKRKMALKMHKMVEFQKNFLLKFIIH